MVISVPYVPHWLPVGPNLPLAPGPVHAPAPLCPQASNGWMLYVQLAVDILARVAGKPTWQHRACINVAAHRVCVCRYCTCNGYSDSRWAFVAKHVEMLLWRPHPAGTVTPSAGRPGSGVSRPSSGASGASSSTAANSRLVSSSGVGVGVSVGLPVPVSVSAVLDELLACHTADALYGLYMRHVVGLGPGAERSGGDDGRLLAFLLQVRLDTMRVKEGLAYFFGRARLSHHLCACRCVHAACLIHVAEHAMPLRNDASATLGPCPLPAGPVRSLCKRRSVPCPCRPQVLGAAREPLFLSQLQELLLAGQGAAGGPGTSGPGAMHAAGQVLGQLVARLGVLVSVSGYRLQGLHRCGAGATWDSWWNYVLEHGGIAAVCVDPACTRTRCCCGFGGVVTHHAVVVFR